MEKRGRREEGGNEAGWRIGGVREEGGYEGGGKI